MKNRFYGKYYKFISDDGDVLACILSVANEGKMTQVITKDGSFLLKDPEAITVLGDDVVFDVKQDDLTIKGKLSLSNYHPLKKKVMSVFSYLPLECKHEIYSMSHQVNGVLLASNKTMNFTDALGYIEGDAGKNFPKKYVWYNSLLKDCTVTMAVATIPLLSFIHFKGILCFIKTKNEEYYLCTYNGASIKQINDKQIIIKKGKLQFELSFDASQGHDLKAPMKGNMDRYIKESVTTPTSYRLLKNKQIVLDNKDETSSLEYMWD